MTELEAKDILRGMTFEECRQMWNERAKDNFQWEYTIHEMGEDSWWEWLVRKAGGFTFVYELLDSGERFNLTDMYFFYDKEARMFISFSTKQEFVEAVEEDFFINEIMNRN